MTAVPLGTVNVTDPYRPEAEELVNHSHRQDYRAVLYPETGDPMDLALQGGVVVTLAEDWSPYCQISADALTPTDAATLAKLDPRTRTRLEVWAGYIHLDGQQDVRLLAGGYLQSREAKMGAGTMPLVAHSAEALAQGQKWYGDTVTKTFGGVREALEYLAAYATYPAVPTWSTSLAYSYRPDLVSSVVLEPGTDVWATMAEIALGAAQRLYVDEHGTWRLEPKSTESGTTRVFLRQGPTTAVKEATDTLTRDGWYDAAVLKYTWRDSAGADQVVYGRWAPTAPQGVLAGAGRRVFSEERTGPITQFQADEAARLTVRNLSTRGDGYVVDAVAAYWLRPGHTVQVDLANGTTARHIVRSVTFRLATGDMTVTTREPSNLGG